MIGWFRYLEMRLSTDVALLQNLVFRVGWCVSVAVTLHLDNHCFGYVGNRSGSYSLNTPCSVREADGVSAGSECNLDEVVAKRA